jgi:hypothetical protein
MNRLALVILSIAALAGVTRADLLVSKDQSDFVEGKFIRANERVIVLETMDGKKKNDMPYERAKYPQLLMIGDHGEFVDPPDKGNAPYKRLPPAEKWKIPPEPAAPLIVSSQGPTYYVIPLHGEVGDTILATPLEKSLADAVARKPTVVILDIDSPGGLVAEAAQIIHVLHDYNSRLRIVVLADKDFSAAAILSLSVKEIYLKSTGAIGAAVSYQPGGPGLPPKLNEKFNSAWRAIARTSAEEGRHEPLLADAMIDNNFELHQELVGGKVVIREGAGEHMLCSKGTILTLTGREAVTCGLSNGVAENYAELGKALGYASWTECKGLGTLLADYIPARAEQFKKLWKGVKWDIQQSLDVVETKDPQKIDVAALPHEYRGTSTSVTVNGVTTTKRDMDVKVNVAPAWRAASYRCVLALQETEQKLKEGIAMCEAYQQSGAAAALRESLEEISARRAKTYDDRLNPPPIKFNVKD